MPPMRAIYPAHIILFTSSLSLGSIYFHRRFVLRHSP
jgi:hypothetical protein